MNDMDLARNPLHIQHGNVEKITINGEKSLDTILKQYLTANAAVICWQRHRISWGLWKNQVIQLADGTELDEDKILEIRVFNENEEIHLVRKGQNYCGRYVHDEAGQGAAYVDSLSRFFGKKQGQADGYITLRDSERFFTMTLPCDDSSSSYYGLVTRNYITADETTGQAGYTDYRFVRITSAEGDINNE